MSALVKAVASVTPTPTPSPSASPVANAVAVHHAALFNVVNYLSGLVTANSTELVVVGAAVLVFVQSQLNKLEWFKHDVDEVQMLRRQLVAVGLPVITMVGASLATNKDFVAFAAPLYAASQVVYTLYRRVLAQARLQQTTPVADPTPQG